MYEYVEKGMLDCLVLLASSSKFPSAQEFKPK